MKKVLTILAFAVMMQFAGHAQLVRYGAQMGFGAAYVSDDLLTHSPIMGFNLGGYADYMFTEWKNPWSENIYLRFGLNVVRRGTNFQQVWVLEPRSIRQGFYHNWYAQIPVIAGFKWEIPQLPAGNFVSVYLGPAINVGLFGRLWESRITPGMPQRTHNYDTYITGDKDARRSFKHMRRIDADIIVGVGYQWHNFTFDLYLDHGFVALMKKDDVLNGVVYNQTSGTPTTSNDDRNSYTGTNQAIMLSIGYQLPINR